MARSNGFDFLALLDGEKFIGFMKAMMKTVQLKGFNPRYFTKQVKSFCRYTNGYRQKLFCVISSGCNRPKS